MRGEAKNKITKEKQEHLMTLILLLCLNFAALNETNSQSKILHSCCSSGKF